MDYTENTERKYIYPCKSVKSVPKKIVIKLF